MNGVSIEIDGFELEVEILQVAKLDAERSAITVRSQEALYRGRSCFLRHPSGRVIDCVVSNSSTMGSVYILEFRCVRDASFLLNKPGI